MENQISSFLERNRRILDDTSVNGHRRVAEPPIDQDPITNPAVGFPIGAVVVFALVMGITTLLSCYYHWETIRNCICRLIGNARDDRSTAPVQNSLALRRQGPLTTRMPSKKTKFSQEDLSLSVVMPGDNVPKYIAWRSPHDPT